MIEAWIAPAATLAGVALGWLLTQLTERQRWRREDRTRWAADRRRLYARFLSSAVRAYRRTRASAAWETQKPKVPKGQTPADLADEFLTNSRRMDDAAAEIRLVAGDAAILAVMDEMVELVAYAMILFQDRADPDAGGPLWRQADQQWAAARSKFEAAARKDLHLPN